MQNATLQIGRRSPGRVPAIALPWACVLIAAATAHSCQAQAEQLTLALNSGPPIMVELRPGTVQSFAIPLVSAEAGQVRLDLQGGLLAVRTVSPAGSAGPWWGIDLGRGAGLDYIVGGPRTSGAAAEATGGQLGGGLYHLEVQSLEREKTARVLVSLERRGPVDERVLKLRDAETALASAEMSRRRMKPAPSAAEAVADYDQAIKLATEADATGLVRLALVQKARYFIFRLDRFAEAHALLQQAVALPDSNDHSEQALAWKTLSSAEADLGEYAKAIEAAHRAVALYRESGDVYWQGIVLGNLSSDYAELGRREEAISSAKEALADAEQELDPAGVVFCLGELADLYRQQGDLESAYRAFREGIAWVDRIHYSPLVEAEIQKDLGLFYVQIGSWDRAAIALNRCLELEAGRSDPTSLEAKGLLGTVLEHQGRRPQAVAAFSSAIEAARGLGLPREQGELLLKRAAAVNAADQNTDPANLKTAESDILEARQLAAKIASGPLSLAVDLAWGDALLPISPGQAADAYNQALTLARNAAEREQESMALAGLARAQQAEGNLADALTSIESALRILEDSRSALANRDLQESYFAMHRQWYGLAVDVCVQLHRSQPGGGYDSRAFAYTERARARALLDTISSSGYRLASVSAQTSEKSARNDQAIRKQQKLVGGAAVLDPTAVAQTEPTRELQRLYRERDDLDAEMRTEFLTADSRMNSLLGGATVDLTAVQHELLPNDAAMVSYWVGDHHSYRWMVTANSVALEDLPGREAMEHVLLPMERALQARRPVLVPGESLASYETRGDHYGQQLQSALRRTGSLLLSKVPDGVRSIFVVADGELASVPFAALKVDCGGRRGYALACYTFFEEPSASIAVYLKQHPAPEQPLHIAVFADPVFTRDDQRLRGTYSRADEFPRNGQAVPGDSLMLASLPRLPGTSLEAHEIQALAPADTVDMETGFAATPAQVRDLAPASVLHFATHTLLSADHPELSGILLSMFDRQGRSQDGVLWIRDIYSLRLPSSLVVLNGCGTHRGVEQAGDGLNSLADAFFYAGAHSVVGTLWSVEDGSATQMMKEFYRGLLVKHLSAAAALRASQRAMLRKPATSSPADWAGFVLDGWPARYETMPAHRRPSERGNGSRTVIQANGQGWPPRP